MRRQTSVGSWIGAVVVVLAVVAAGVYLAYKALHPGMPITTATQPASSSPAPASAATSSIQHPIAQAAAPASASTAPLPALDDSDASVAAALATLAGGGDLRSLLLPQQIITRIVATVDTLPRHELGTLMLPLHTPKGAFTTAELDGQTVISEQNAARYAPYMQIVDSADPKTLVAWYVHAYPLFQQAYRQLGYPRGYFNDRLIAAIDDMLAAPESAQSAALVRSHTSYVYADPALESLSAGQRLLLRTGPANEARIKTKLRAIRAELTGQVLPATPATGR
ncbi:MAG: DUF3014 domain-containing protein [Rhodanobacter sp.]